MIQKWKFYSRQAFGNIRKNYLIIVGFTLTLSLVAGLSFYVHELEEYIVKENNFHFDDIIINYDEIGTSIEGSYLPSVQIAHFGDKFPQIEEILNGTNLAIETTFLYNKMEFPAYYNLTSNSFPRTNLEVYQMDQLFYNSPRFEENFEIISGGIPTNQSMIMIPESFAVKYQLSILDNLTIQLHYGQYNFTFEGGSGTAQMGGYMGAPFSLTLPDFIVSGIYTLKKSSRIEFLGRVGIRDYEHRDFNSAPFFMNFEANQRKSENSFISAVDMLYNDSNDQEFGMLCRMKLGVGVLINRDGLNVKYLTKYINNLDFEMQSLEEALLPLHFSPTLTLLRALSQNKAWIKALQLNLQFINVPVLLFSIYIGSFFVQMNFKSRLDEVLLLKVRGVSFNIIRNQFLIENGINGVIASLLGSVVGWFSKSIYYATVTPYLFQNSSEVFFTPNFSFWVFPRTCLIGVIIAILASIRALKPFKSMEMAEILNELDKDNLDVEYDENSLFGLNENEKREICHDQIEYSLDKDEQDLYNDIVDLLEKQRPKKAILMFILAIIPVGYFLFQIWGPNPNNPDWVYYISHFLTSIQEGMPFIMLAISVITPILLTIGLIKLIVTDSPSRFARLTKKIVTPFLHNKAHLAGLQIIKEKKISKMIFVFALLSTVTIYSNGIINSSYRNSAALDNYQVGGDAKIMGRINTEAIQNHGDVLALEEQLLSIQNDAGQFLINDISSFYYFAFDLRIGLDACFLNFSDYSTFLDSSELSRFDPALQEALGTIIQFNENATRDQTAILQVSQTYNPTLIKENYLGKTSISRIRIYDSTIQNYTTNTFPTLTLCHSTILPGFDIPSNSYHSYNVYDLNHLNITNPQTQQFGSDIGYFIDLADDIDFSDPKFKEELTNLFETAINGSFIDFTIEISQLEKIQSQFTPLLSDSGIFGLLYTSLMYIGCIFALALAVILVGFHQDNSHITSILRAQGLSRKYVRRVITSQIFVTFLLSCGIGGFSGFLSTFLFLKIMPLFVWGKTVYPLQAIKMPVYFNFLELAGLLGFIIMFSSALFLLTIKLSTRQFFNKNLRGG